MPDLIGQRYRFGLPVCTFGKLQEVKVSSTARCVTEYQHKWNTSAESTPQGQRDGAKDLQDSILANTASRHSFSCLQRCERPASLLPINTLNRGYLEFGISASWSLSKYHVVKSSNNLSSVPVAVAHLRLVHSLILKTTYLQSQVRRHVIVRLTSPSRIQPSITSIISAGPRRTYVHTQQDPMRRLLASSLHP
ncbi:hypothetical protein BDZ97DRAFT_1781230, partial [Flammula alnicola]